VAETGQSYAFTGDDPLNSTDPLGDISPKVRNCLFAGLMALGCADDTFSKHHEPGHTHEEAPEVKDKPKARVIKQPKRGNAANKATATPSAELGPAQVPTYASQAQAQQAPSPGPSLVAPAAGAFPWAVVVLTLAKGAAAVTCGLAFSETGPGAGGAAAACASETP
jgi:hypothetical protein